MKSTTFERTMKKTFCPFYTVPDGMDGDIFQVCPLYAYFLHYRTNNGFDTHLAPKKVHIIVLCSAPSTKYVLF